MRTKMENNLLVFGMFSMIGIYAAVRFFMFRKDEYVERRKYAGVFLLVAISSLILSVGIILSDF